MDFESVMVVVGDRTDLPMLVDEVSLYSGTFDEEEKEVVGQEE
jgi:hypothetical protein